MHFWYGVHIKKKKNMKKIFLLPAVILSFSAFAQQDSITPRQPMQPVVGHTRNADPVPLKARNQVLKAPNATPVKKTEPVKNNNDMYLVPDSTQKLK